MIVASACRISFLLAVKLITWIYRFLQRSLPFVRTLDHLRYSMKPGRKTALEELLKKHTNQDQQVLVNEKLLPFKRRNSKYEAKRYVYVQ